MTKQRYLVQHDYGMGALWWWIHARSPREILETFAEVEVMQTAEAIERAEGWGGLDEVDIDILPMPPGLDGLRERRDGQRDRPGFGALADREIVYLRHDGEEGDASVYLTEVGSDGRRIRQVELTGDGAAIRYDEDSWFFNPPLVDLYDPDLPQREIERAEFERAWANARPAEPEE
ncbi:hypothetical protein [Dactylosporangium darangshiense]|uniref:Uncharacterized protein n=1 Tax=Dactylosporangium darangshiense TaxID=579108 RepID=A0ABP8DID6_9ACTN